jgi:hypothetical protein
MGDVVNFEAANETFSKLQYFFYINFIKALLNIDYNDEKAKKQGFSVTPALLSTFGALTVLAKLECQLRSKDNFSMEAGWLGTFAVTSIWSEYTLYAIVLHHFNIFDRLHIVDYSYENV